MKNKSLQWSKRQDREKILQLLLSERVIAGSTDTVSGLFGPLTATGKEGLDEIKGRSKKPYLILISSKEKLFDLIDSLHSIQIEKLIDLCWPGPLTLIFKAHPALDNFLQSERGTIAVRMPNHPGLLEVLQQVPGLFSTSANVAGKPVPLLVKDIDDSIQKQVAAVVDNGGVSSGPPSTILDVSGPVPQLVREGAYPLEKIEKILGMKVR